MMKLIRLFILVAVIHLTGCTTKNIAQIVDCALPLTVDLSSSNTKLLIDPTRPQIINVQYQDIAGVNHQCRCDISTATGMPSQIVGLNFLISDDSLTIDRAKPTTGLRKSADLELNSAGNSTNKVVGIVEYLGRDELKFVGIQDVRGVKPGYRWIPSGAIFDLGGDHTGVNLCCNPGAGPGANPIYWCWYNKKASVEDVFEHFPGKFPSDSDASTHYYRTVFYH